MNEGLRKNTLFDKTLVLILLGYVAGTQNELKVTSKKPVSLLDSRTYNATCTVPGNQIVNYIEFRACTYAG